MSEENEFESNEAKRQRLMGVKNDEEIHASKEEIKKGNFFANLWYRHKWFIIIGAIFLIIGIFLIVQLTGKESNDMVLMYAGPQYIGAEARQGMMDAFEEFVPDYNNDKEKHFNFINIVYQTPEQRENKDNFYEKLNSDKANLESLQAFQNQTMSGEVVIYLLDPNFYEEYKDNFVKLTDLIDGEIDENLKYGECGIYFKKTAFAKKYECFDILPDDTIMCVMVKLVTTNKKLQENSEDFFAKIVNFD